MPLSLEQDRIRKRVIRLDLVNELIHHHGLPLICYFCGEEVTKLEGLDADSLVIHSIDGNHDNWDPENKTPAHQGCHSHHHNEGQTRSPEFKHHASEVRRGDKNPNWKGGISLDKAEWERERYHRLKEQGLCPKCGEPLDREGTYCSRCIKKERERRHRQALKNVE